MVSWGGDGRVCDIFRTRPGAMIYWVIAKTNSVSKLPFVNVLLFYFILVHCSCFLLEMTNILQNCKNEDRDV